MTLTTAALRFTAIAAFALGLPACAEDELLEDPGSPPGADPDDLDIQYLQDNGLIDDEHVIDDRELKDLDTYAYGITQLEGENMANRSGASGVYYSPNAWYGNYHVRTMFANGEIGNWVWVPSAGHTQISVAAQGSWCTRGWPHMTVYTYDQSRGWYYGTGTYGIDSKFAYDGARYFPYHMGGTWMNAGWNFVSVVMSNDSYVAGYCDANLVVDYVNLWRY